MLTNHEKAIITFNILQKRRKRAAKRIERDYLAVNCEKIDKTYKKNYKGRHRIGQV